MLTFFIWYGVVRFLLETLRSNNWLFFGVPVAQLVSLGFVGIALAVLVLRHRRPRAELAAAEPLGSDHTQLVPVTLEEPPTDDAPTGDDSPP